MNDKVEFIKRLRLGASISRNQNLRDHDFATIADAANFLEDAIKPSNNLDEYAVWAREMWFSDKLEERDITIMSLGLPGEVGEVIELLKKRVRDEVLDVNNLKKELGDVLYYWAMLCTAFDLVPSDVIKANQEKLTSRHKRGVLHGSGNDR